MSSELAQVAAAIENFAAQSSARMSAIEDTLADFNAAASVTNGRRTDPEGTPAPRGSGAQVLGPVARKSDSFGFGSFGEFAASVRRSVAPGAVADERLQAASVTTSANESSGDAGGFAVPPTFRAAIMEKAFGEDSLFARCFQVPVAGNNLTMPTTMSNPWDGTGIQAYWTGEQAAITQSKPDIEDVTVRLHKLAALVPCTEELLEDAPAMSALISRQAGEAIDFKLSTAIAYGSGAGQPLGFMNAGALATVAAEGGQTADTINATNVAKMFSALPAQHRRGAVWLIHPDAEHQLPLMTIGDQPIFTPPGAFSAEPYGRLMGRPVIPHQVCQTLGDLGDIMLVDLGAYLMATKAGGLRAQTSIHLWFDQDITAFKFTIRVAGQPWWSTKTTSDNGSFEMSPFVTLAARA